MSAILLLAAQPYYEPPRDFISRGAPAIASHASLQLHFFSMPILPFTTAGWSPLASRDDAEADISLRVGDFFAGEALDDDRSIFRRTRHA